MRGLLAYTLLIAALAGPAWAQEDEDGGSFIENWLEENLSSAGRDVQVRGFAGLLSSQATVEEITIADDDGVWFTLRNAELDWTRSALFSGRLEINTLRAEEIEIARRPLSAPREMASSQASSFALPDLPVSVDIGEIAADRVVLGEPVLGVPVELQLTATAHLEGGEGSAELTVVRTDDKEGELTLAGSYSNESRVLDLALSLSEEPGGLVATLIGLPGRAGLSLTAEGNGPIDDFVADITLATDNQPRLTGQVSVRSIGSDTEATGTAFNANLSGDVTALFLPEYQDFFGPEVSLAASGRRYGDGRLVVDVLSLAAKSLNLEGDLTVNALGWPERVNLTGSLEGSADTPVVLPVGGERTEVQRGDITLTYDSATGEAWSLDLSAEGFSRAGFALDVVTVTGGGTLVPGSDGARPEIDGTVNLAARGITAGDAALQQAIGDQIAGSVSFNKADETPLRLTDLTVLGQDYQFGGSVTLATDVRRLLLNVDLDIDLIADRLARFSGLVGQPLTGAAQVSITGQAGLPGGPFDLDISGTTRDLGLGIDAFDRVFAGQSTLTISAVRDETGTRIETARIETASASLDGRAGLSDNTSDLGAVIEVRDAALIDPKLAGTITLNGAAQRSEADWSFTLTGTLPGETDLALKGSFRTTRDGIADIFAEVTGSSGSLAPFAGIAGRPLAGALKLDASARYDPPTGAFGLKASAETNDLALGLGEIDRLLQGPGTAEIDIRREEDGTIFADRVALKTPEITVDANGITGNGDPVIGADVALRDLGLIVPGLPGAFTASGTGTLRQGGWQIDVSGNGPGGTTLAADGTVRGDFARADLGLSGRIPLEFANAFLAPNRVAGMASFDLVLSGPLALSSVSGSVTANAMQVALPNQQIDLSPMSARANLSGGRATIDVSAEVSTGGSLSVTGPVALSAPYSGDLSVALNNVGLIDPDLFETTATGQLTVSGPLTGGAQIAGTLNLDRVEMKIPEAGFGVTGGIPDLKHIAEPADVRQTRMRAGLLGMAGSGNGGGGAGYLLDVTINAPSRIFLRGRGLDAEFGGTVLIGGSTNNATPRGAFDLIRGRLDILGRRLTLTEGSVTLQGSLDPYIRLAATTEADDITVQIILDGQASNPVVRFESTPSLPEEDVLAYLIFGRGIEDLSPLQALKLASAVATLAGRGGAGIIGNLREGFGLDDLDLTTDVDGNLAVRAGTYISENAYTEIEVDAEGKSQINLNLNVTSNITVKGRLSDDGDTGIGVFYEKDY